VTSVTPAALSIAEGENSGAFTVTGIPQAVMTMTIIDVTVSASLGGQTMTAPVSVVPEAPTPGPVIVAGLFSTPVTGVPGVTSLDLFTPPPLPRGQDIQGRVQLDAVALTPTVLTIVPTPSVLAAIGVIVPAGSTEGYFQFALDPSASSLQITVLKDSFVSKAIDIAVAPL
jgi:hypothetical protein